LNPPIYRWAIVVLSLRDKCPYYGASGHIVSKNLPLKGEPLPLLRRGTGGGLSGVQSFTFVNPDGIPAIFDLTLDAIVGKWELGL